MMFTYSTVIVFNCYTIPHWHCWSVSGKTYNL